MFKKLIPIAVLLTSTTACSGIFSIHTIDVQQGNSLTDSQVAGIQEGMSREEIVQLAGQPILRPIFNPNRWDYVYRLKKPDVPVEEKLISVFFVENKVASVVGK